MPIRARVVEVQLYAFLTLALDEGERLPSRVQDNSIQHPSGWVSAPAWTFRTKENLASAENRNRTLGRPVRSAATLMTALLRLPLTLRNGVKREVPQLCNWPMDTTCPKAQTAHQVRVTHV